MLDIQWLISTGPCLKFSAGQNIPCSADPNDPNRAMYILLSGRVNVFKTESGGQPEIYSYKLVGDVFGGDEFFANAKGNIYTASQDSAVFVLNEKTFSDISWSKPDIIFQVLKASYMPIREVTKEEKAKIAQMKAEKAAVSAAVAAATKSEATALKKDSASKDAKDSKATDIQAVRDKVLAAAKAASGIYPQGHNHEKYIGITEPDYAKLVFKKDYKCPACKKTFDDVKIFRSKLYEARGTRFDLRKFYRDFKTEWYEIIICRHCFFSTFSNYFVEPKPLKKEIIEKDLMSFRERVLIDFSAERDLAYVFTSYYLALICAEGYINLKRQIKAKIWSNLSWLYEDAEDEEMMKYAALKAADEYEDVFANTHLTPTQEQMICLSVAGMQHRAGIDKSLKKYLFTAKTIEFGDARYARLADEFMYDLRIGEDVK